VVVTCINIVAKGKTRRKSRPFILILLKGSHDTADRSFDGCSIHVLHTLHHILAHEFGHFFLTKNMCANRSFPHLTQLNTTGYPKVGLFEENHLRPEYKCRNTATCVWRSFSTLTDLVARQQIMCNVHCNVGLVTIKSKIESKCLFTKSCNSLNCSTD